MKTVRATFRMDFDFTESIKDLEDFQKAAVSDEETRDYVIDAVLDSVAKNGSRRHVAVDIQRP